MARDVLWRDLVHAQLADAIRSSLRDRVPVPDELFDMLYPDEVRERSHMHWTPVSVAVRAAALLTPERGMRVLDAGAGPGKLCCIGALVSDASWVGVERDHDLVETARRTAETLAVGTRAQFQTAEVATIDWAGFDGLYFYNPFEAALVTERFEHLTAWVRYTDEVAVVEAKLARLRTGTRVVTYHGYGGEMPPGFALRCSERMGIGTLDLWEKVPR